MIVKMFAEFASELVLGIPYAYWLHNEGVLDTVYTTTGMEPFYYFCDDVRAVSPKRTINNKINGLLDLPNDWIHHNALAVTGKNYDDLSDQEKADVNGVLDYDQWEMPPYAKHFWTPAYDVLGKFLVVNNIYNLEVEVKPDGRKFAKKTTRHFELDHLRDIFDRARSMGYAVIYKRPDNTEFSTDENERITTALSVEFDDRDLCEEYDHVFTLSSIHAVNPELSYNELQLRIFSMASGFITVNGGGGLLCACFDKPTIIWIPEGKELRPQYYSNPDSYINKLSDADIHPIYPGDGIGEVFERMKIFEGE